MARYEESTTAMKGGLNKGGRVIGKQTGDNPLPAFAGQGKYHKDLIALLKEQGVKDDIVKKFVDDKITPDYFMKEFDFILENFGIENKMQSKKLQFIAEELRTQTPLSVKKTTVGMDGGKNIDGFVAGEVRDTPKEDAVPLKKGKFTCETEKDTEEDKIAGPRGDRKTKAEGYANGRGNNEIKNSRMMSVNVTGAKDSTLIDSNSAGIVHGGMGNKSTTNDNRVDRSVKAEAVSGNVSTGDHAHNEIRAEAKSHDLSHISSTELVKLLKEKEISEDTINKFREKCITGELFFSDNYETIMNELNIDIFDKMKLDILHKNKK